MASDPFDDQPAWMNDGSTQLPTASSTPAGQPSEPQTDNWQHQSMAQKFAKEKAWKEYGGSTPVDNEHLPEKLKNALHIGHFLSAFFICLCSTLSFMANPDLEAAIILLYLWFFGLMLCAFETPLKMVNEALSGSFGFMENSLGRACFLFLVGMLSFAFGVWGIVSGVVCFLACAANLYAASLSLQSGRATGGAGGGTATSSDPQPQAPAVDVPPASWQPGGGDDV